jgi:NADH-quinone oxidoreductase subunit J
MNNLALSPNLIVVSGIAGLAALAAVGVVYFNNAIRSAMCLVLNFLLLAILYFTLNAEMLGVTQVAVYTGAIMVLFLFVIMLLNLGAPQLLTEKQDPKRLSGLLLGVVLFGLVASQLIPAFKNVVKPNALDNFGGPHAIGRTLFSSYAYPLEAVSVLLLIGLVGSILLAKRRI